MLDTGEWYYRLVKGRIAVHVARGGDNTGAIAKSARTIASRGDLDPGALARMIAEVEYETVQPFLGAPWNQLQRLERFNLLRASLLA